MLVWHNHAVCRILENDMSFRNFWCAGVAFGAALLALQDATAMRMLARQGAEAAQNAEAAQAQNLRDWLIGVIREDFPEIRAEDGEDGENVGILHIATRTGRHDINYNWYQGQVVFPFQWAALFRGNTRAQLLDLINAGMEMMLLERNGLLAPLMTPDVCIRRAEIQAQQAEAQALLAEARAQQAEARILRIEVQVQQAEERAQQAEARALRAEARALLAEVQAQQAEALAQQAEARRRRAEVRRRRAEAQVQEITEAALQMQDELVRTQDELARTQDELVRTQDELARTQAELVRTQAELRARDAHILPAG
jgi:hypothetical protein